MKKLFSIILTLAIALLPVCACAESNAIMISDPALTVAGETVDLSGVAAVLFGELAENGAFGGLKLLANGSEAGQAVVSCDDNAVVFYLSGMESSYGIPMEAIAEMMNAAMAESGVDTEALAGLGELAGKLENWDIIEKLGEALGEYIENNAVAGDPETIEAALPAGTIEVEAVPVSFSGNGALDIILSVLDSDEIMVSLIPYINEANGTEYASYAEMIDMEGVTFDVTVYAAEDDMYDYTRIAADIVDDGETVKLTIDIGNEAADMYSGSVFNVLIAPEMEDVAGQYVAINSVAKEFEDSIEVNSSFAYDFGEDDTYKVDFTADHNYTTGVFNAALTDTAGIINGTLTTDETGLNAALDLMGESYTLTGSFNEDGTLVVNATGAGTVIDFTCGNGAFNLSYADAEGTTFVMTGVADTETGIVNCSVDLGEGGIYSFTAEPVEKEGYDSCCKLTFDVIAGADVMQLSCYAGLTTVEGGIGELPAMVDLSTADETVMEAFEGDLTNALVNIIGALAEVPAIATLLESTGSAE